MKTESIVYGFVGLIIGGLISFVILSPQLNNSQPQIKNQPTPIAVMRHGTSMEDMVSGLKGKTGDAFDREFIKGMIEHHEGAIKMAEEAKVNAGHEEIKKMADEIIVAQSGEIEQMKQWQKDWGI